HGEGRHEPRRDEPAISARRGREDHGVHARRGPRARHRIQEDVRRAEAGDARRFAVAAALCFVVLVDVVAWWGQGRLASPAGASWSPEIRAESPPLARFDAGWYRT